MEAMGEQISSANWLYTTPEKIVHNEKFCNLLRSQAHRVTLVVYDEAHEWLETWRSGIQECVSILQDMFPTCARLACTATCRVSDAAVLKEKLIMEPTASVVRCSVDRKNCYLHVTAMTNETTDVKEMFGKLRRPHIEQIPQALVFVTSQDQAERMEKLFKTEAAGDACFTEEMIASYHAATPKERKSQILDAFIAGIIKLIICTSAFGTGVDIATIYFIFHYTLPPSITAYLQNIGRGGRNGMRYDCYLYFSYKLVHECAMVWFASSSGDTLQKRWRDYVEMIQYPMSMTCRRSQLIPFFDDSYAIATCGSCDICLIMDDDAQMQLDITTCARLILAVVDEFGRREDQGVTLSRVRDVVLGIIPRGTNIGDKQHTLFGCGPRAGYTATNKHVWMMAGTYLLYGLSAPLLNENVTSAVHQRMILRKVSLTEAGRHLLRTDLTACVRIRYPIELMAYDPDKIGRAHV
jgi:ATP-dependent DNA helicase RecQ